MKAKIIKRVVACALAATMVIGMSLTAFATEAASSSSDTDSSYAATATQGTSTVAGAKSTTAGVDLATAVTGSAVTTPTASIASGYGLASNEIPYTKLYNFDAKKSTAAKAVIDAVAASQNATVGPIVNVELGKMSGGKFSLLNQEGAPITLSFGIPANFATAGATYGVIRVTTSGVEVLQDTDSNPNTVTFNTTGGRGVYAIVKY